MPVQKKKSSPHRLRFSPYPRFWPCLGYRQEYQTWTFLVYVHDLHQDRDVAASCSHFRQLRWGFLGFPPYQFDLEQLYTATASIEGICASKMNILFGRHA